MTFKVGDKVRYNKTDEYPEMEGFEAEVVRDSEKGATKVQITKAPKAPKAHHNSGYVGYYLTHNLELITPTFSFADIQVGDKIRRTETWASGSVRVFEGVVKDLGDIRAYTPEGLLVGYVKDAENSYMTLELLDRPKPKHWTETKPVGSVGIILDGTNTKTLHKTHVSGWSVRYIEDGSHYKYTNDVLEKRSAQWDESKLTWIK